MNFGRTMTNFGRGFGQSMSHLGQGLGNMAQSAGKTALGGLRTAGRAVGRGMQTFGGEMAKAAPGIISGLAPMAGAAIGSAVAPGMGTQIGAQLGSGIGDMINNMSGMSNMNPSIPNAMGNAVNAALPQSMQGQTYGNMIQQGVDQFLPGMGGAMANIAGMYGNTNLTPQQHMTGAMNNAFSSFAPSMGYATGGRVAYPSLRDMVRGMSY